MLASSSPIHLVFGCMGLDLCGLTEWDAEGFGRSRRPWLEIKAIVEAGGRKVSPC